MKKFAVTLADGNRQIIEAANLHDAISKARMQYGQLPNDINAKIVNNISDNIDSMISSLSAIKASLQDSAKNLDWNSVYATAGKTCDSLNAYASDIHDARGSLVKVDK